MASASIRFFVMKDAGAVKDADADQCKRTIIFQVLFAGLNRGGIIFLTTNNSDLEIYATI